MLDRVRRLFFERGGTPAGGSATHDADELHVAAAALMVEAARLDQDYDPRERERIEALVRERFGLNAAETATVLATAEQEVEGTEQLHGFARIINDRFAADERAELMTMLWQVILADGRLDHYESNLMRRIAGLLYVSDRDSGLARQRAQGRIAAD
jgi:uncharacterized tellurite resistance protein B-like protein